MSIIWVDSFDHMQNGDMVAKYNSALVDNINTTYSVDGRASAFAMYADFEVPNTGALVYTMGCYFRNFLTFDSHDIFGLRVPVSNRGICSIRAQQGVLKFCSDFNVFNGAAERRLYLAPTKVLKENKWYAIEAQVFLSTGTDGYVKVYTDGDLYGELTGIITVSINANFISGTSHFFSQRYGGSTYLDNLWVVDNVGTANTGFLGESLVNVMLPTGNGNQNDFTNSSGTSTNNYLYVDEVIPDDDTTYTSGSIIGDIDLYKTNSILDQSGNINIIGLSVGSLVKDPIASGVYRNLIRTGGTNYSGDAGYALTSTYKYNIDFYDENPNTTAAWTYSDISGLEIGMIVES